MHDYRRQRDPSAIGISVRSRLAWAAAFLAMLAAFLAPALWNGFPLIFSDTGGYLARPFEHTLVIGRSAFYGAFLAAGLPFDFWPNIVVQATLCVWLLTLALRVGGLGGRPFLAFGIGTGLAVLTSLPWFASQLMPDILLALAVLALILLAFHIDTLTRAERVGLAIVVAAGVASHMAALALAAALLLAFAIWNLAGRLKHLLARRPPAVRKSARQYDKSAVIGEPASPDTAAARPLPALSYPCIAIVGGIALALFSNLAVAGQFAFTPGGETFLFGRLIQDGIIGRYLTEHCPDAAPSLCAYREQLSPVADDWLWSNNSPLYKVGGWRGFASEERRIIVATLLLYPKQHLERAVAATLDQLRATRTTVSTDPADNADATATIERLAPAAAPQFRAARQQHQQIDTDGINLIHLPVAFLSIGGLLLVAALGSAEEDNRAMTASAATVLLALVLNAAICGVFSNASDRYESRLIWLAPLFLAIALARRRKSRRLA